MNTIISFNIATGDTVKFTNVEDLVKFYCALPLEEKIVTFVMGLNKKAMDYPAMMYFMFDFNKDNPSMIDYLMEVDEVKSEKETVSEDEACYGLDMLIGEDEVCYGLEEEVNEADEACYGLEL